MTENIVRKIWQEQFDTSPTTVRRFPTGICNFVYYVESADGQFVMRLNTRENKTILSASLYWLDLLKDLSLPLPRILRADLDSETPWVVLSYLKGRDLGQVYTSLNFKQKEAIAKRLVAAQRELEKMPIGAGYGYLSTYNDPARKETWKAVVLGQLERSRNRIAENGLFDPARVDVVVSLLSDYDDYFSHIQPVPFFDDATTKNVLIHDGELAGIVDLDWLCFGDRLFTVALTRMSLIAMKADLDYIDCWCRELALNDIQRRVLNVYTLVFCVDFMSEKGMRFNKDEASVVPSGLILEYEAHFENLYAACAGENRI